MCVCAHAYARTRECVLPHSWRSKDSFVEWESLLPPISGFQGLNSGYPAWKPVPLATGLGRSKATHSEV